MVKLFNLNYIAHTTYLISDVQYIHNTIQCKSIVCVCVTETYLRLTCSTSILLDKCFLLISLLNASRLPEKSTTTKLYRLISMKSFLLFTLPYSPIRSILLWGHPDDSCTDPALRFPIKLRTAFDNYVVSVWHFAVCSFRCFFRFVPILSILNELTLKRTHI